jgi:hypothetical protein
MDMIFTFCDRSHGEAMVTWPGHPATSIWTVTDPTATHSSDKAKEEAFAHTCDMIKERISALVKRVALNKTVLMVEHNLSVVSGLSDTITVLARGEVLAEGEYSSVSSDPRVIEAYLGTAHG